MPISKDISKNIIDTILKNKSLEEIVARLQSRPFTETPLPPRIPKDKAGIKDESRNILEMLEKQGIRFQYLNGEKRIEDPEIFQGNIENFIGLAQLPVGVIGPLRVNGLYANGDFYVPMATTEGALVASHNRGAKLISLSGGARAMCLIERVSRAPGFKFDSLIEAGKFLVWTLERFDVFESIVKTTTRHGQLEDMKTTLDGNQVYLSFEYTTGDASGQNTVTIATEAICQYIIANSPVKPRYWFVESNLSGDKKATAMSYSFVREKRVIVEVIIPRDLLVQTLCTTPEMMLEYWKMSFTAGVQSGSIGVQGHYANALAAIFIACGQDVACVSEASVGTTRVDVLEKGDLYVSVSLPNLIVGTVGGGTNLPTQEECLAMMKCKGEGTARKFAEICAVCVLAGEISITGALAARHFTQAHINYGRKRQ